MEYTIINRTKTDGNLLSLDEAKRWLKIDTSDEDELISTLIKSAEQQAEDYLSRSISRTTISVVFRGIDIEYPQRLPLLPLRGVLMAYGDGFGNALSFEDNVGDGTIMFDDDVSGYNEVMIGYECGSNDADKDGMKVLLLQLVAMMYERRGDDIDLSLIPGLQRYSLKLWV